FLAPLLALAVAFAGGPATASIAGLGGPAHRWPPDAAPTLVLLSLDGWRWDYDRKAPTPNLHRLMARGVRAERLIPSFPSKTFPNHYTVVTGLYPGDHGIVANNMYDPATGQYFGLDNREAVGDAHWWG